MQLKKRTSKPVPPPAKICSFLFGRSGSGLIGILVAIAAVGLMIPPITRWYITMAMGTDDLAAKMERQTILQDKWNTLNATSFDDITELITAKGGSSWSEDVGKYTITTTIDAAGKYANAACTDGTPGEDDRQCRQVHLTIKDNETGQTQALDVTKIAPENGGGGGGGGMPDYSRRTSVTTASQTYAAGYYFCVGTMPEDGFIIATSSYTLGYDAGCSSDGCGGSGGGYYVENITPGVVINGISFAATGLVPVNKGDVAGVPGGGGSLGCLVGRNRYRSVTFIPVKK